MNTKISLAIVSVGALLVGAAGAGSMGCGSSTTGSGGTTGTTTSTATTSTKAATGTGTTATGTATSTGTAGNPCNVACQNMHTAGYQTLLGAVTQVCGCMAGSVCNTQCASDMACQTKMGPPMTGSACDMCIQAEGAKGQGSACATQAAFGTTCQGDTDCKALITCFTACAAAG